MSDRIRFLALFCCIATLAALGCPGCDGFNISTAAPSAASGVSKATVKVHTGEDGLTVEQRNIAKRLDHDNRPGSIKYLYLISAYSGQVIYQSTVDGKVTSGGKRLTPKTVAALDGQYVSSDHRGMDVHVAGRSYATTEVLQDDGTYGDSGDYLFWFDMNGVYHQQYTTGGTIVHVSDQPIAVHNVIINLDTSKK